MLQILQIPAFRHMFSAQIVALLGTGLSTVALGLLAYDLTGGEASMVLGVVFGIKMVAYVGIAPIAGAFAGFVPRRKLLVGLDCVRALVACLLPFVAEVWQIFVLIFVMQAASAAFTPTFQATLPDILPQEKDYTRALSLSRLAYDIESIITPTLAALVLLVASYHELFYGTAIGFIGSGLLILSVALPKPKSDGKRRSIYERTTRGIRIYLKTPRLQGLLALCMVVAAIGAMVLVNSVVLVQAVLGLDEIYLPFTIGAFGLGSMVMALILPRLLDVIPDRVAMLSGASMMVVALTCLGLAAWTGLFVWAVLLVCWFVIGAGYSAVLTPSGRLLQRSSHEEDRPAIFAAQFALSHACWLICYPLAGFLQTSFGVAVASSVLAVIGFVSLMVARQLWPAGAMRAPYHTHPDLPHDHPHLQDIDHAHGHAHIFVIDDHHMQWPHMKA